MAEATPSEEHVAAGLCCNDPNNTGSSNTDEDKHYVQGVVYITR